jgi:ABC-type multidrug transport system fused ATPase/permease subunit
MDIPAKRHLLRLFRERKRLVARFVVTSLGQSAATMAGILLINEFLSGVLGGQAGLAASVASLIGQQGALIVVAALLLATYVLASLFRYDNTVVQQRLVKVLELGMMEHLVRHILSLSVPFFDRQSHGDIIQAVRQDVSALRTAILSYASMFLNAAVAAGLVVAAWMLSPFLTVWALVVMPLALLPIVIIARRTRERSFAVRRSGYRLFDAILQILRGIRVIKAYRGEDAEAHETIAKGRAYFDSLIEIVRIRALSNVVLSSLSGVGVVVVVVLGGFQVLAGALEWPALLAFLMALRTIQTPLNAVNSAYVTIKRQGAAVTRIEELLDARPEVGDRPDAVPLTHPPSRIAFEDVELAYDDEAVLRNVSFSVPGGSTVGIAGPSGAGKTTLVNLICRFYDPTEGRVTYDGRDLRDFRVHDVYDQLAIVTQRPFLFAATLRSNIGCGRPEATDEEIIEAARAAEIHDEIIAMPDGYDTRVGVGERQLSLGQAQRVSLARALLKNAPLLILDEATASLDSLAEAKVQRAIDRLMQGRTTFIVAHRLSTLRGADRILVLQKGHIVGDGPHHELVQTCPLYRRMWETQQLGAESPVEDVEEGPSSDSLSPILSVPGWEADPDE